MVPSRNLQWIAGEVHCLVGTHYSENPMLCQRSSRSREKQIKSVGGTKKTRRSGREWFTYKITKIFRPRPCWNLATDSKTLNLIRYSREVSEDRLSYMWRYASNVGDVG